MQASVDEILHYWFGEATDDAGVIAERSGLWFDAKDETDAEIHERFGGLTASAAAGEMEKWVGTPRGRLALILLLDQFSRNIHRGTPAAFAQDHLALAHCLEGQSRGQDAHLRPIERAFFYLPMEHAEALPVQDECVRRFERLENAAPSGTEDSFARFTDSARRHRDIILRFDRFPHRNAILGRTSTPAELAFLEQPGSSF